MFDNTPSSPTPQRPLTDLEVVRMQRDKARSLADDQQVIIHLANVRIQTLETELTEARNELDLLRPRADEDTCRETLEQLA